MSGLATAKEIASAVREGRTTAKMQVEECLARIEAQDDALCSCTRILSERALARARQVDEQVSRQENPGPLAGVPFGAKDLFDIAGLPNTGGAASRLDAQPASHDAEAIRRLENAGAILVASCNMDEFAYGFATVNAHYGTTRNPHDTSRLAGGSSGGSAAAVAAGLFPLSLGSDTNGSIRVPAALCGIYGLKPTHGHLPLQGVLPFVDSFDDIGPFATSGADLYAAWSALRGDTPGHQDIDTDSLKVARLGGFFDENTCPELLAAIDRICGEIGANEQVTLPDVAVARSAAYLMTAAEGGGLHLSALRRDPMAFDPATRDRLIAGALIPSATYFEAKRFREYFLRQAMTVLRKFDVLIAPAAPTVAPPIDNPMIEIDSVPAPARAHLGIYTQPLSFIGLPSLSVPIYRPGKLPLGLQLVAAPGRDDLCFALAEKLDTMGLTGASAPLPTGPAS